MYPTLEELDPRTLLVDMNIPGRDEISKGLLASIKDKGVLQAVVGYRTADGPVRVRFGHRRTLHAIAADRPTIPVIVVGEETEGNKAEIERVLGQYDENTHREGISEVQEAGMVAQLLDLGISATALTKRMQLPKDKVAAAKAVHGSETAKAAAAKYGLDILQSAAIAEFDGDEEAVAYLYEVIESGGNFRHAVQTLRDRRAEIEAVAGKRAELEAAGVKTIDEQLDYSKHSLRWLLDAEGNQLDEETHKDCPGHVVFVSYQPWWRDKFQLAYFCADPEANGHKVRESAAKANGEPDLTPEEQSAQRRETIANNKLWRSATTVRQTFVKELLTRKKAPEGATWVIIQAIAVGGTSLRRQMERAHKTARPLLGLPEPEAIYGPERLTPLLDMLEKASDDRALVIALGLVLGAYEDGLYVDMWKNPGNHAEAADYFTLLKGWGYGLSEIEQLIVDSVAADDAADAAAEADEAGTDDEAAA